MPAQDAVFLKGNLFRHITVMTLTSSVGLMAVFLVDFIDMVFISMLGKAELAAAIGYAGAILFFTSSIGIGMAIAAGAQVSRALGEGEKTLARNRASTALVWGVIFGSAFAALIWLNVRPLAELVGATGETLELAVLYLRIIIPSLPLLLVGMVGGAILRAHGAARRSMMATIWGAGVNAVLDPILIFGLDMELTGAALASVCARITIALAALYPIFRHHGGLCRPSPSHMLGAFVPLLAIAGPAMLTQIATPVGQAYVTRAMAAYGEEAVAGMAIIARMSPVAFATIFALSGAIGPVIGQNFGAGRHDRVRRAWLNGMLFALLVVITVTLVLYLLRPSISALFEAEGIAQTLIYLFCGPLALLFFFNGAIFVSNAAFNNLGRPLWSTWINWGRNTLGTIPLVLVCGAAWGAPGVLIGQALGGVAFAILATILSGRIMKRHLPPPAIPPFARQGRLLSLMNLRR